MVYESVVIGGMAYAGYRVIYEESIKNRKLKKKIENKWNILMDGLGSQSENKIKQEYKILKVFHKHYGFDCIISMPLGKQFTDMLKLIPFIEICFSAEVMANLSKDKDSVYLRVHKVGEEISSKDKLKFSWFRTFYNLDGGTTKTGETLGIDKIEDIKSPTGEVVGYRIKSKIPVGLSYEKIKNSHDVITKTLGKCFFNFNFEKMQLEVVIANKRIDDKEKFTPIKVKPHQLYVAMGYDWNPIILDYSQTANTLIGGMQGTGKTVSLITGVLNLCSLDEDFVLMVCNKGEKQDLKIFRNVKQCQYYANTKTEVLGLLRYLVNEMNRRNAMFPDFCFNIYEYNKITKDLSKKLKVVHFIADEIADLMAAGTPKEDSIGTEIQGLLWSLIRKGRSSGIYVSVATQRGSLANLSGEVKGQLGNKICFSQPNVASALTIASGEDVAKQVMSLEKRRECLVDYPEGQKVAKTLYIDSGMMKELLAPVMMTDDKNNRLNININGKVIEKVIEEKAEEISGKEIIAESKEDKSETKKEIDTKNEPRWKKKKAKK